MLTAIRIARDNNAILRSVVSSASFASNWLASKSFNLDTSSLNTNLQSPKKPMMEKWGLISCGNICVPGPGSFDYDKGRFKPQGDKDGELGIKERLRAFLFEKRKGSPRPPPKENHSGRRLFWIFCTAAVVAAAQRVMFYGSCCFGITVYFRFYARENSNLERCIPR